MVVIQDVRGRGTSAGEFDLFRHETDDGEDTVNWVAQLSGSNGQVGMYGFSYQGMTQLYAASRRPTALRTIAPAMVGYNLHQDWAYEGEAFCLQGNLSWAIQLAAETARLNGDEAAFLQLRQASHHLPLQDPVTAQPKILQRLAPDSFYHDWLNHPDPQANYWQQLQPDLSQVNLPMLHIGGWFDPYLRGTLRLYQEMVQRQQHLKYPQHQSDQAHQEQAHQEQAHQEQARQEQARQELWIGPWGHLPWGRKVGAVDYGPAAVNPIDRLQLRWFNHFLKGQEPNLLVEPTVHLFTMGLNQWHTATSWPPATTPRVFHLKSTGLATMTDEGQLVNDPVMTINPTIDTLVHDPWRPVPALGGHAASPPGSFERQAIDDRSDVLTYTTAPLATELTLVGDLQVELFCTCDRPSFDLCAVISTVSANGMFKGVFNITQGYLRVAPGNYDCPQPFKIELQPTCTVIPAGQRLRLSLSAACFPAYGVNPGTGQDPSQSRVIEAQIITLSIYSGGTFPSRLQIAACTGADSQGK
jgi:putative CocE/NonD family hydrolase